MIDVLRDLDRKVAVGLLARAALSLESPFNPAVQPKLQNEIALREQIFVATRAKVGIAPNDDSAAALEKIGDALDQEADGLEGPLDVDAALRRLAASGDLPGDMYEISINPAIANWLGRDYDLEVKLIEEAVRRPDREQHYGATAKINEPSFVSLFLKRFSTRWPFKDFQLLVVAGRNGMVLDVHQAWRIFPSLMNTSSATSLVDVLKMFTSEYGAPITWEGRTASFFLTVQKPLPINFNYRVPTPASKTQIGITQVTQTTLSASGQLTAALAVSINVTGYLATLERMRVSQSDIIDSELSRQKQPRHQSWVFCQYPDQARETG